MSVRIITGGIGSGKTRYCVNTMKKAHASGKRCVMLVPSHYSHEAEKLLINEFGGTGFNGIEVTSFEKLARELLKGTERRLAAPGKQAVICRAIRLTLDDIKAGQDEYDGRLLASMRRSGFADAAGSVISELHRYLVTGDMLRESAERVSAGTLRQKLLITALISDKYDALLSAADYIDSDEDLLRLSSVAADSFRDNSELWLDRFDEFLPQQFEVLKALIESGMDITVTFTVCPDEEDTYYGTRAAIKRLSALSDAELIRLDGTMRHIKKAPDLKYLFSSWHDRGAYTGKPENAEIFEARDAYTETEHIACRILDLVREENYRFRDIAVICGSPDDYGHIIEAIFGEYGIPYYSDDRFSIAEHPIAMQILSLFDIIENNWDYSSVFGYLRAGFVYTRRGKKIRRIPSDDIDKLENYVLKYGIRGKSMWCSQWFDKKKRPVDAALGTDNAPAPAELDVLRALIAAPIEAYSDAIKGAVTVTDYCRALYAFLEAINLYSGLKAELLGMAMDRASADAQRFGQIWNLALDVLDQVNTALGSYEASPDEFADYLRAAMTKCGIRTIPSGADRVFIGSVEKDRSENSKVIFAVGAISGTFPTDTGAEGFFSNADRETLAGLDIALAPTTVRRAEKNYNSVYKTLSAVTEKLCVSYPAQTPDGKACRPSQTVIDIQSKLPGIRRYNDIITSPDDERRLYISSPAATLHRLLIHPRNNPLWSRVGQWFDEHGEWRHKLFTIRSAQRAFSDRPIRLRPELARQLYHGMIYYSPTRLNTYAQCPFKSFIQYGLRAKEREVYELNAADTGTYAHDIVRRFCERVDKEYGWHSVTDADCERIVDELVSETTERLMASELPGRERTADIFRRMGHTVKEVSKTVLKTVAVGSYEPYAYEMNIRHRLTENTGITGTIDRVDMCRHDDINEYRIIDYKTGNKTFSVSEICAGLDMQPVIYALVIRDMAARRTDEGVTAENALITGMYYGKMRDDLAELKAGSRLSTAQNALRKNTMLDGVSFVETDADGNIVPESANRIESEPARADGSIFFGKDGPSSIGKNIHSIAAGSRLMDTVRDKIKETDRAIRGGNIEISPLETGGRGSICDYCGFGAVCKFDECRKAPRHTQSDDDAVWDILEGKKEDEE